MQTRIEEYTFDRAVVSAVLECLKQAAIESGDCGRTPHPIVEPQEYGYSNYTAEDLFAERRSCGKPRRRSTRCAGRMSHRPSECLTRAESRSGFSRPAVWWVFPRARRVRFVGVWFDWSAMVTPVHGPPTPRAPRERRPPCSLQRSLGTGSSGVFPAQRRLAWCLRRYRATC